MALDVSADNLRREIESAIKLREEISDLSAEFIKRLAGPDYRTTWEATEDQHENYAHEIVYNTVPALFYSNPGIAFECAALPQDHPFVRAETIGMNQWAKGNRRLERQLTQIAYDACVDFGVAMVTLEKMPGYDTEGEYGYGDAPAPTWPAIRRVSPTRFFSDPQASDDELFRFRGHLWIRDKDDLLAAKTADGKPKFNREVVEGLVEDGNTKMAHREIVGQAGRQFVSRKQVVGYEVYVPETGMIYTLGVALGGGSDGQHEFVREPRKYFGPKCGPYVMYGLHIVPDQVYPVSPLALSMGLIRELNAHAGQASQDAATAKRLVIVDSNNLQMREAVTNGLSSSVIGVPGFDGKAINLDLGGPNPENLNHIERLRGTLDRLTGLTDFKRGNLTGVTAREVAEASAGEDTRTKFLQSRFRGSVVDTLMIVAAHLWESSSVRFDVNYNDPATGEEVRELFIGGDPGIPGITHVPFSRLKASVSIEPYSMEMIDQGVLQRRSQTAMQMTLAVLAAARQFPELKVREVLNDQYEALNIPDGASRYVDMGILAIERQRMRLALGLAPGGPGQPGQPQGDGAESQIAGGPNPPMQPPGENPNQSPEAEMRQGVPALAGAAEPTAAA